ncbi:MAG: hypothetical protein ABIT01_10000 [Thermoanaerobaculia bacterium]
MTGARGTIAALFAVVFGSAHAQTPAAAKTGFDPRELRLRAGNGATADVYFSTDDPALASAKPKVELEAIYDVGAVDSAGPILEITFDPRPVEISRSGTRVEWKDTLRVASMPSMASAERIARLVFTNGVTISARYSLGSRAKTFTWTVATGTKTVISPHSDALGVTVLTTGDRGTNLRIDGVSLHETSSGLYMDPSWLSLDRPPVHRAEEGIRTLALVRFDDRIPSGNYTGSISFAVDESQDAKVVEIGFSRSTAQTRGLGLVLLCLGVLASFVGGTLARGVAARADALLPAVHLLDHIESVREKLRSWNVLESFSQTKDALAELELSLSPRRLRTHGFVPSWLISPFGVETIDTNAYAKHLEEKTARLAAIDYVLKHGIHSAVQERYDEDDPKHQGAREDAFNSLDALASDLSKAAEQLAAEIPQILRAYQAALHPPPPGVSRSVSPTAQLQARPTFETLSFTITVANTTAWLIVLCATVATGWVVLIASNPGFGISGDYVKCFLWGLGVQIAGQQLSQLTPSSVTSALKFKVPAS